MSVAVSPYLAPPQALGFGNEQPTDLLDALLASCQKSAMNSRLPGYGRTLQPYFTTEIVPAPRAENVKPGSQNVKNKGKPKKLKGSKSSTTSSSDEESTSRQSKSPAKPTTKSPVPAIESQKGQTIKAIHKQQKAGPIAGLAWAGPSFGMAPAASEIPIPSDFLLV